MPDTDFMLTAEERRQKQLKRRRIFISVLLLLLLLVLAVFGGRPTLNAIKSWQARRHAAKAFAQMENENWLEARKEAMAAYQLRPTEPQSIRAVARFLSRTRQPDALEFWRQLENVTPLTREDRQDEAAIAIALGETARAEHALRDLRDANQMDAAAWLLAAQLSIQKGAADEALSELKNIFDDASAPESRQLQAALLELSLAGGSTGTDERVTDAWSRIEKVATGKSAGARDALVLLAQRELSAQSPPPNSQLPSPISQIAERLSSHPLSKAPQKLMALDLQERIDASRRDELIAKGIADFKNGDASDLLALATWLNGKAEFEKTIDAIPLEKALQSRELFLQHLDALGGLERWSEIKQLLQNDRYPLDPVVQKMYLARCNAQLGEKAAAENNWQRALEAAAGDPGKLLNLGDYAEKNGVLDVAKSAFENAAQQSPKLRPAQQGRLRMAQRTGETKKIHDVLADMLKIWPNDAAVQNDEGYTRLLLQQTRGRSEIEDRRSGQTQQSPNSQLPTSAGEQPRGRSEIEDRRSGQTQPSPNSQLAAPRSDLPTPNSELQALSALAENLVARNPRSLPHRTFLALARLKQNRPAEALAVYDNVTVAPRALTQTALAIHAVVLAANGRAEEAQTEARQVKLDQLLPEERKLVEPLTWD